MLHVDHYGARMLLSDAVSIRFFVSVWLHYTDTLSWHSATMCGRWQGAALKHVLGLLGLRYPTSNLFMYLKCPGKRFLQIRSKYYRGLF